MNEILGAIYRKDLGVLGRLTRNEVNMEDEDKRTPLMHAVLAEDADPSVVRMLIERGAEVNAADRDQRWTPLHFAARDGNTAIVDALLEAGASVDATNVFGNTPLWEHIKGPQRNPGMIEKLLLHGADPKRKNNRGVSPIDLARLMGREDLAAIMENRTG
jgi:ankyrin repeat protein